MSDSPFGVSAGPQAHAMDMQRAFPSGAAEWRCATCGRWTIVALPKGQERLKIVVLDAGNEHVVHHSSAPGVIISAAAATARDSDEPPSADTAEGNSKTLH